jgi:hypothetical protein
MMEKMKSKLTLLGALVLAMVILTASPAMADVDIEIDEIDEIEDSWFEFEGEELEGVSAEAGIEEVESGDAEGSFAVTNWGDLSNQSVFGWNFLNTGNAVSAVAISQEDTETDDIEIEGSSIWFGGELEGESTQGIVVR